MINKIITMIKPYLINYDIKVIWGLKSEVLLKTPAYKKCKSDTKEYITRNKDIPFECLFKKAPNFNIGIDLLLNFCEQMIPLDDLFEFYSILIFHMDSYSKFIYAFKRVEYDTLKIDESISYVLNSGKLTSDQIIGLIETHEEFTLQHVHEDLNIYSAKIYLLMMAQDFKQDSDKLARAIAFAAYNDIILDFFNLLLKSKSGQLRNLYALRNIDFNLIVNMFNIIDLSIYVQSSVQLNAFQDIEYEVDRLSKFKWKCFVNFVLIEKWLHKNESEKSEALTI